MMNPQKQITTNAPSIRYEGDLRAEQAGIMQKHAQAMQQMQQQNMMQQQQAMQQQQQGMMQPQMGQPQMPHKILKTEWQRTVVSWVLMVENNMESVHGSRKKLWILLKIIKY
jgi:hypothetical protein